MSAPHLVIFDCDGVLVDSEPVAARVLSETLHTLGWPVTVEQVDRLFRGRSLRDCQQHIEEHLGRALPADFIEHLNLRTYKEFEATLEPVPFVREALDSVLAHGLPVCVASSGSHDKMRLTLGLTGLLPLLGHHLFSSKDVARGKPFPDLFLHAAASMGVFPEVSVVIEDSVPGILGGRAAGMRVLGYAASGNASELEEAGAEPFTSMRDLPRLLGLG